MQYDIAVWDEPDPHRIIDAAEKLDGRVDRLWIPETITLDSVSIIAAVAARTRRLQIGAAILNIYTRSIPLIAMTAGTLQLISRNRFSLGIGVSTSNILDKHGVQMGQPISQLRQALKTIRQSFSASKSSNEFHLPFKTSFPIYVGTIGERMSHVAGELSDGLIFNCVTPEHAKRLVASARLGRKTGEIDFRTALIFSLNINRDRESITRRLAYYAAAQSYSRMFKRAGFATESERAVKAWSQHKPSEAQRAISQEMVDAFTITPESLGKISERYTSVGIKGIILVPVNLQETVNYLTKDTLRD